jgi:hypothetical protein
VRDVVQAAVSEATFRQTAQKMQKTLNIPLVGNPVKTVEVLAQRYVLNEGERAGVLRHLIVLRGQLSGYGCRCDGDALQPGNRRLRPRDGVQERQAAG